MSSFWMRHQVSLVVFIAVLVLIALSNLRTLRRLGDYPWPAPFPSLSVLVPARNEANTIGPCVHSLLAQKYPDFEVLILDDDSDDGTGQMLTELAVGDSRLRVLAGGTLPADWLGKHWACHQLAQAARGELLLFTDADTIHHPHSLGDAVAALLAEGADLLSALPRQEVVSWAERLIVPVIPWSILSFLPLALAYRLHAPWLSAANGQFMLFRRQAYEQVGGHAAVRDDVVDDLALARRIKAAGLCWRLMDGGRRIRCRMYQDLSQVSEGLSKNLFAVFGYNVPLFVSIWLWLGIVFGEPVAILILKALGMPVTGLSFGLAAVAIAVSLLLWGVAHWRFGFPLYLAFLYPLTITLTIAIAMRSLVLTLVGRTTWKGRPVARHQIP